MNSPDRITPLNVDGRSVTLGIKELEILRAIIRDFLEYPFDTPPLNNQE